MTVDRSASGDLRALLAVVRRRWFRAVALRTGARSAGAWAAAVLFGLGVDRLAKPEGAPLALLALVTALAAVVAMTVVLRRMQRRPNDRQVARFVEERTSTDGGPAMDDALVSAVDVIESPGAQSEFGGLIVGEAVRRLRAVEPAALIPASVLRRAALEAAAAGLFLAVAIALSPSPLSRAIGAARLHFFPGSVQIHVEPGNARVPAGSALHIRATLRDRHGALTLATPELTVSSNGASRTVEMRRDGDEFEFAFDSVDRSFTYTVAAGAARSSSYTVTALVAPRVRQIDLDYTYPAFTGLKPRTEMDGGDIYAPAGTRVRLRIRTDKPVADGEIATSSAGVALRRAGDCLLEGDLVLTKDDSYRLRLLDDDGLRTSGDTEYFIRLMDDRPPNVRILRPSADQPITPLEEVVIEARADDDYGIAAFDLVYAVAGGPAHTVRFDPTTGTSVEKIGSRLLQAEDLGVQPGDVITYYARVRDVPRGKRSTETRSEIFFLEVKPFNEEFVAAQSQASSGASSADLEGLVAAQKEIISATWNIERRSAAGRSADDVSAVAKAQAELKSRAERMTRGSGRGPGRAPAPERAAAPQVGRARQPAASADPVASAVAAMGRAVAELEAQKTQDAIPHEMAALTGLLKAQAEIKRREVSQGASGSGNSGNRSSQDLTALFDKELQRQQRTNYETRASVEDKPGQSNQDAALERIRDLAKRQEDLSRRQRELADAGLTAEETKRQLEKLTREQMELRRQAEELAKRQQAERAGDSMQGAADSMRSATSDLRRDDAKGAAENGSRAAEQLRRAEGQLRGGPGGTPAARTGELQADAQQIEQEQRRIASDAERLERSQGVAAADARRRLADDKERLAGRVDALQQSAARQGRSPDKSGADDTAARDAAEALARERVADQMRESARSMRDGRPGAAAQEQAIARSLERSLGGLGGGDSAEARKLSEELERTRDIRDRLNRLEQQMRQAEAGQPDNRGPDGRQGRGGTSGNGKQAGDLRKLQQEYQRELERARDALGRLAEGQQRSGTEMSTPEQEQVSRSAPGTEAFKQDRSAWDSLREEIDLSLEKYEASLSDRLARRPPAGRLNGGGSDGVPDSYRAWIGRYYQSLATVKK